MGERQSLQQMVLGKLDSYMQKKKKKKKKEEEDEGGGGGGGGEGEEEEEKKKENGPYSYTVHKNKLKMD